MILAQSIAFVRDTGIVISWLFVCFVLFCLLVMVFLSI